MHTERQSRQKWLTEGNPISWWYLRFLRILGWVRVYRFLFHDSIHKMIQNEYGFLLLFSIAWDAQIIFYVPPLPCNKYALPHPPKVRKFFFSKTSKNIKIFFWTFWELFFSSDKSLIFGLFFRVCLSHFFDFPNGGFSVLITKKNPKINFYREVKKKLSKTSKKLFRFFCNSSLNSNVWIDFQNFGHFRNIWVFLIVYQKKKKKTRYSMILYTLCNTGVYDLMSM